MTWGNFQRRSVGYIKRQWVVNREIIAAIKTGPVRGKVTGNDVFDFGVITGTIKESTNREYINRRHEHLKSIKNGINS